MMRRAGTESLTQNQVSGGSVDGPGPMSGWMCETQTLLVHRQQQLSCVLENGNSHVPTAVCLPV